MSTATAAETIHKHFLSTPKKTQQSEALHDRGYGITSTANDDTRSWRLKEQFALTLRRPTDSFFFFLFLRQRGLTRTHSGHKDFCASPRSPPCPADQDARSMSTLHPCRLSHPPGGQKHRQDGESGRVVVVVVRGVSLQNWHVCRAAQMLLLLLQPP